MFATPLIFSAMLAMQAAAQTPPTTPAPTAQVAAQVAATAPQTAQPRPRRICESRAPTGRRLEQRICYTPEQYTALTEAKRRELEEIQSRNNVQYDRTIVGITPGPL